MSSDIFWGHIWIFVLGHMDYGLHMTLMHCCCLSNTTDKWCIELSFYCQYTMAIHSSSCGALLGSNVISGSSGDIDWLTENEREREWLNCDVIYYNKVVPSLCCFRRLLAQVSQLSSSVSSRSHTSASRKSSQWSPAVFQVYLQDIVALRCY